MDTGISSRLRQCSGRTAHPGASRRDYRIYINGETGIPPKDATHAGYVKIQVPFFTVLLPRNQATTGMVENSLTDWWNGGRLLIYDNFNNGQRLKENYDVDQQQKAPYGFI